MAANACPVTPERVRKILSSFLSDGTKKGNDNEYVMWDVYGILVNCNDAGSQKMSKNFDHKTQRLSLVTLCFISVQGTRVLFRIPISAAVVEEDRTGAVSLKL